MPADPGTTLCQPSVRGASVAIKQQDPASTLLSLCLGSIYSTIPLPPALRSCKMVSALALSSLTPSPALVLASPNRAEPMFAGVCSRGALKHVVLAGGMGKALCYPSPCPAALTGMSLRSLDPRCPPETQGGGTDSGQDREKDTSRSGERQVTQSLRQPRLREHPVFSVFAFEKGG